MSSMVSLGVWAAGQVHPRATQPMEVVTTSIYVTPGASSCTMQLAHIVATVGLSIASDCMCSRGTLKVVAGNGPPHRQAITSLKPGDRGTTCIGPRDLGEGESCSVCSTYKCSSALQCQDLLASELQWQCLHFGSTKAGDDCPVAVTGQEGCSTFSHPGKRFGGASILAHSSCSTQWHGWLFKEPPNGGCFLHGNLISGGGWGISRNSQLSPISKEPFQEGHTTQDNIIRKRDILFHCLMQFEDGPHQKVWLIWHRQIGPFGPALKSLGIHYGLLQLFLPDVLAGEPWIWQQEEIFLMETLRCWWSQIVIFNIIYLTYPLGEFKRGLYLLG